jgi:histidine ammonia-lyase
VQVTVGAAPLTVEQVVAVARDDADVVIAGSAVRAMETSRAQVEALARSERPAYGVSTGFGALATTHIPPERRADLQGSLIRSHAASSGAVVERDVVRAMMLLRLRTLATGRTGVRPVVAQRLADLLNAGITPVIREFGSLGCSGDLAPLAHVALALMGEGERAAAIRDAGLEPVALAE